jgi:hypothetical protein
LRRSGECIVKGGSRDWESVGEVQKWRAGEEARCWIEERGYRRLDEVQRGLVSKEKGQLGMLPPSTSLFCSTGRVLTEEDGADENGVAAEELSEGADDLQAVEPRAGQRGASLSLPREGEKARQGIGRDWRAK